MIYFDAGATTLQKPPEVAAAMVNAMENYASPGRGGHRPAMDAAEAVFACRDLAGRLFDTGPENVVFTMNATHALNIAIRTLVHPGDRVVISGFEHNAVTRPLHYIGADTVIAGRRLFDMEDTLAEFDRAVTAETKAVICTHVSNVFGYILPVEQIAALCAQRGVPFILDASQSAGALPVSLKKLNAAFIAMPGHKGLYGPQGTGLLLCGQMPAPLMQGGSGSQSRLQEMPDYLPDGAEAGTQNVCGICGLAAGLQFVEKTGIGSIGGHERLLRERLVSSLQAMDGVTVFDGGVHQLGTVSFLVDGEDCEKTASRLAAGGCCVRAGLHCAPTAHESARTLDTGTVRASFSFFNTAEETERFCELLKKT